MAAKQSEFGMHHVTVVPTALRATKNDDDDTDRTTRTGDTDRAPRTDDSAATR